MSATARALFSAQGSTVYTGPIPAFNKNDRRRHRTGAGTLRIPDTRSLRRHDKRGNPSPVGTLWQ